MHDTAVRERRVEKNNAMLFGRRVRFAIVVLISHVLLIALGVAWFIQMMVIALNGSVRFVENNIWILSAELVLTFLISAFGLVVLVMQLNRLGERRQSDRREGPRR